MRISDWSSDVCSSDLVQQRQIGRARRIEAGFGELALQRTGPRMGVLDVEDRIVLRLFDDLGEIEIELRVGPPREHDEAHDVLADFLHHIGQSHEIARARSEEHTSELQSLMRTSYAFFCLKKQNKKQSQLQ